MFTKDYTSTVSFLHLAYSVKTKLTIETCGDDDYNMKAQVLTQTGCKHCIATKLHIALSSKYAH